MQSIVHVNNHIYNNYCMEFNNLLFITYNFKYSSQNIHLVAKWLPKLEKKLEQYGEGSHESYRVYISAGPAGDPSAHIIPQGILESSIKITNEPPTGMLANLHKALDNFNQVRT